MIVRGGGWMIRLGEQTVEVASTGVAMSVSHTLIPPMQFPSSHDRSDKSQALQFIVPQAPRSTREDYSTEPVIQQITMAIAIYAF